MFTINFIQLDPGQDNFMDYQKFINWKKAKVSMNFLYGQSYRISVPPPMTSQNISRNCCHHSTNLTTLFPVPNILSISSKKKGSPVIASWFHLMLRAFSRTFLLSIPLTSFYGEYMMTTRSKRIFQRKIWSLYCIYVQKTSIFRLTMKSTNKLMGSRWDHHWDQS